MTTPLATSTPISRRNQRRQQKLKNKAQQRFPSYHERLVLGLRAQSRPVEDPTSNPAVEQSPTYESHNSNRFSVLDVFIPSPELSIPPSCQESFGNDLPIRQHDLYGIEDFPITSRQGLSTRKSQDKQLHTDSCAFPLQQNPGIVRSESPSSRKSKTTDPALIQPLCSIFSEKYESDTTITKHEDATTRVPSPLLYHRRSKEASSGPISSDFSAPGQSIHRYSPREPMLPSEIRGPDQQEASLPITNNACTTFIAARLPLIGDAPSRNDSTPESGLVRSNTLPEASDGCTLPTAGCMPPIRTTTNTYIFPKRIYKVHYQPRAAWSGPSYTDTQRSWNSTRKLVFPKLSIAEHKGSFSPRPDLSESDSSNSRIRYHRVSLKTSLPAPLTETFDSRCRSSTQDSFDSKFNVHTATKQIEPSVVGVIDVQQHSGYPCGAEGLSVTVQEPISIGTMSAQTEDNTWSGDMTAWFSDAYNVRDEDESSNPEHTVPPIQDQSAVAAKLGASDASHGAEDTSEQSPEVWFDHRTPFDDTEDDTGSVVHVDISDIEIDDGDWVWDNQNEWETIVSTPATELDAQLQFGEDKWAW